MIVLFKQLRSIILSNLQQVKAKGSFAQNFAISLSGSVIVTALGFLLTPVMARIYTPAAYGQFAVFNSIISNLGLLSTMAYPNAIPLPKTKDKALALLQLILVLSFGYFVLSSIACLVFGKWIMDRMQVTAISYWFYSIPVILLLFNLSMAMNSWYTRTKEFKTRAGNDVLTSVAGRLFTLGYGFFVSGQVAGLVIGDIFSKTTLFIGLLRSGIYRELGEMRRSFSWKAIRAVAREYREFPLYMLPGGYINTLSAQLPIFLLTSSFGSTVVGLYSFSVSLLEIPVNLIGNAVAPVFYQKASETYNDNPGGLKDITLQIFNKLLYIGLLPFGIITIYGDVIFKFVFGARWEMAGVFTGYLGYYYIFKLTSQSTASIYTVLGKQRYMLLTNVLLLLVRAAALGIGIYMKDVNTGLLLFGIGSLVAVFMIDMHILHLLKLPVVRIGLRSLLLMGGTILVLKLSRVAFEYLSINAF
ncbi:lipopolysaccharide biosynthesis protein [Hymenobacter psychrotolerans]|uniref:Membrane protein involved in the export of O-antigen and teichoic acid n=1 Tax=Hymenobacter psychrotolerans DSM 18569 TaxID=1121959 RepID=A0A1M7BGT1_9BACT|nr:oligosaccharide flippase family protein [Hymenobacter psychrotolerans]SHL54200.1 Membrane protein involved in the export of O-antigen and teichoic acid [Hymenobacter psychrotolerans DSM 18569]